MSTSTNDIPSPQRSFDFNRALRFVFEDPDWLAKTLAGALFTLLSLFVVGGIWIAGYVFGIVRRTAHGETFPLPDWHDLRGLFTDGLRAFAVSLAHVVPLLILAILLGFAGGGALGLLESSRRTPAEIQTVFILFVLTGYLFFALVGLAVLLYFPAAFLRFALSNRMSAAFEFRENFGLIRRNLRTYAQVLSAFFVASFIAQLGVFVLCIGFFPAAFWSTCVLGYGMGELAREDESLTMWVRKT